MKNKLPLVIVPSSFSHLYEIDLENVGANIIIYANHLIRAAYPAMQFVAKKILENERSFEIEKKIIPKLSNILNNTISWQESLL